MAAINGRGEIRAAKGARTGVGGGKRGGAGAVNVGIRRDSPALGGGDAVEAVEEAAQGERRAVVGVFFVLRGRFVRRGGGGGHARRRLVARDAARERGVEVLEEQDASVASVSTRAQTSARPRPQYCPFWKARAGGQTLTVRSPLGW